MSYNSQPFQKGVFLGFLAVVVGVVASQAQAQRLRFVTPVDDVPPFGGPPTYSAASASNGITPGIDPTTTPSLPPGPGAANSLSGYPGTTYAPGGYATPPPGDAPQYVAPGNPQATLNGTVAPLTPGWDPYADPGAQPSVVYPQNGYMQPDGTAYETQQLWHRIYFNNQYLADFSSQGFGMNSTDINTSFAFPFFLNPSPVLITPGFTLHLLDGPASSEFSGSPDLPPQLYDAYLDTSWQPVFSNWFSADLNVRIGVYSDFEKVNTDSILVTGHGAGVFTINPRWQAVLGAQYLDRPNARILPVGGLIWTPNEDTRYELVFPWPRVACRWTTVGNTDIWWYGRGEYGGGRWTVERANGFSDDVTYNDLRVAIGLEMISFRGLTAWTEVGYVFDRDIMFSDGTPDTKPDDTIMIGAGVKY